MMSQTTSSDGLMIGVDGGATKVAAGFVSSQPQLLYIAYASALRKLPQNLYGFLLGEQK